MFGRTTQKTDTANPVENAVRPLPMDMRCDRCGAHAMVRAMSDELGTLLFCYHDFIEHKAGLSEQGFMFDDRSASLS